MQKIVVTTCSWLGVILLFLSIFSALLDITVVGSNYIVFYGFALLGLIIGLISWFLRGSTVNRATQRAGKIGFFGNFAIVILFYPPIYHIWGTLIFGP